MKKSNTIILCSILILFGSCTFIMKKMWHVKNPKIETETSLIKYLKKHDYDPSKLILLKDMEAYRTFLKLSNGIPNAMFFNERGEFVDYRKTPEECNGSVGKFIETVEAINEVHNPDSLKISDLNVFLANKIPLEKEITVVMTWAVFAGKVNKVKSLEWIKHIDDAKAKGVKINYYLLNCDILDTWGVDSKDLTVDKSTIID